MSLVRVHNFAVSLDGFGSGGDQSLESPFGHAGDRLMRWFFDTRSWRAMHGQPDGSTGADDSFASKLGTGRRGGDHGPQQVRSAAWPVG